MKLKLKYLNKSSRVRTSDTVLNNGGNTPTYDIS